MRLLRARGAAGGLTAASGGESIFDKPFRDEFHQRLRFSHRGLVAMANSGANDNSSQFFFTLDKCEELNKKNTIFGKVTGNTIFNVLQMAELPVGPNERPEDPPKITSVEVLKAYFDDIVPRSTPESRRAAAEAAAEAAAKAKAAGRRKVKGTKNFKLLSFGDEAEDEEEETLRATAKVGKIKSSHEALGAAKEPLRQASSSEEDDSDGDDVGIRRGPPPLAPPAAEGAASDGESYDAAMRSKVARKRARQERAAQGAKAPALVTRADRIGAAKEEAERLLAELKGGDARADAGAGSAKPVRPRTEAQRLLDEQAARYEKSRGLKRGGKGRADAAAALLAKFESKLAGAPAPRGGSPTPAGEDEDAGDDGWMGHELRDETYRHDAFVKSEKAGEQLTIDDPRNPLVKRRRKEASEGKRRRR